MNLLGLKMGWIHKLVAAIVLTTLIASAFPASFFVANAAEESPAEVVVAPAVPGCMDPEATNYNPEADFDDESCEYPVTEPVLETIEVCKYTYGEGESYAPLAGWEMLVTNTLSEDPAEGTTYNVVTGSDGCVTPEVDPDNGPWYVGEDIQEGWYQFDVDVVGGYVDEGESEISYCVFFDEEIVSKELSRSGEYDYSCDFYNYDDREEVSGYKWSDDNNNGVHDEGEEGVAGWTITATDISGYEFTAITTTTDGNGFYSMLLPADGEWVITEETRSNWTQTAVYKNGYQLFEDTEEGAPMTECTFEFNTVYAAKVSDVSVSVVDFELYNRCDFLNHKEERRSGGGGTRVKDRAPQGEVLGAATSTPSCSMYLHDYMRMGKEASSTEVTKLQVFLNAVGIKVEVTGMFDAATDAAVKAFQAQHKADVLTPWFKAGIVPHENPTGWVYQLTRWKINNIVCPGSEAYPSLDKS